MSPARRDVLLLDDVLGVDGIDVLVALVGAHGHVGDNQHLLGRPGEHAHIGVHARHQGAVVVVKDGTQPDSAGLRVNLVIKEVEPAPVREAFLVHQRQFASEAVALGLPRLRIAPVLEERAFLHIEVAIDGINRDDRGQHGGRSAIALKLDEVAGGHEPAPDLAADRSLDLCVVEINAGRALVGLGGDESGFGFADCVAAAVVFLLRDCLGAPEAFGALKVVTQQSQMGLGLLALGLHMV